MYRFFINSILFFQLGFVHGQVALADPDTNCAATIAQVNTTQTIMQYPFLSVDIYRERLENPLTWGHDQYLSRFKLADGERKMFLTLLRERRKNDPIKRVYVAPLTDYLFKPDIATCEIEKLFQSNHISYVEHYKRFIEYLNFNQEIIDILESFSDGQEGRAIAFVVNSIREQESYAVNYPKHSLPPLRDWKSATYPPGLLRGLYRRAVAELRKEEGSGAYATSKIPIVAEEPVKVSLWSKFENPFKDWNPEGIAIFRLKPIFSDLQASLAILNHLKLKRSEMVERLGRVPAWNEVFHSDNLKGIEGDAMGSLVVQMNESVDGNPNHRLRQTAGLLLGYLEYAQRFVEASGAPRFQRSNLTQKGHGGMSVDRVLASMFSEQFDSILDGLLVSLNQTQSFKNITSQALFLDRWESRAVRKMYADLEIELGLYTIPLYVESGQAEGMVAPPISEGASKKIEPGPLATIPQNTPTFEPKAVKPFPALEINPIPFINLDALDIVEASSLGSHLQTAHAELAAQVAELKLAVEEAKIEKIKAELLGVSRRNDAQDVKEIIIKLEQHQSTHQLQLANLERVSQSAEKLVAALSASVAEMVKAELILKTMLEQNPANVRRGRLHEQVVKKMETLKLILERSKKIEISTNDLYDPLLQLGNYLDEVHLAVTTPGAD